MLLDELKRLISKGESESLEFKKTTGQKSEAVKTVCAFLNGLGGIVIFGVSDCGTLVGQHVVSKTLEDIANELKRIEPPAFPEIKTIPIGDDKKVIVILVPGENGTYTYDGRSYLRHGPTTQIMPKTEYEKRLIERLHAVSRWENQPVAEGISVDDLDHEEIRNVVKSACLKGRMNEPKYDDVGSLLMGLELIYKGKLLNAALALFGKNEQLAIFYPQFSLRVARFKGTDRLGPFHDNRRFWGNAFSLLRKAETFLLDHIPIAGRVMPGKMIRDDYPLYPQRATREALTNAICHRDYACFSGSLAVAMYDDHLEIINPGTFHYDFTPEKLLRPHYSKPWNPIIAEVFYRAGVIECWGTGTLNIVDWCKENHNPLPKWEEQTGSVVVTFYPCSIFSKPEEGDHDRAHVSAQESAHVNAQDKLLLFCKIPRSSKEMMSHLGIKHRGFFYKKHLTPMLEAGLLSMTAPTKPKSRNQQYFSTDAQKIVTK